MIPNSSDEYHPRPILVYDLDCGFCRWSVARVLAWDKDRVLDLATLQEPGAAELLSSVPADERMKSSHLVMPDGTVYSGGAALAPLAALLPAGAPVAFVARSVPGLMNWGYRQIAENRMKVSKLVPAAAKARADEQIARRRSEP
ncbi:MAG: hypothetical protein QOG62_1758 [Thermoleophilaceae bacterium]|nr:hypothetical protein [Thermoleophilaceae bacterium]